MNGHSVAAVYQTVGARLKVTDAFKGELFLRVSLMYTWRLPSPFIYETFPKQKSDHCLRGSLAAIGIAGTRTDKSPLSTEQAQFWQQQHPPERDAAGDSLGVGAADGSSFH